MPSRTVSRFWPTDASDWATCVVVVVVIISTLWTQPEMPLWQKLLFLALMLLYTPLTIGGDFLRVHMHERHLLAAFFVGLSLLGSIIFYLSWGSGWLVLLPIAAQTVYCFSWCGTFFLNLLIFGESMLVIRLLGGEWSSLVQSGVSFIAAQVFVIIFTNIAAKEEKSRLEVERLAGELSIANQKLRQYAFQVEEMATLQERNRLARDIHDGLGHYLTALNMQLKAAQAVMVTDVSRAQDALKKAQVLAQDALESVRQSVSALREYPALQQPLPDVLAGLLSECQEAGLVANLDVQGDAYVLSPSVMIALYRAVQEGLTNVRKHALASRVDVFLTYLPECVYLKVVDNGVGMEQKENAAGFGLMGLRERVALLGGEVRIETVPQKGFALEVEIGTCGQQPE